MQAQPLGSEEGKMYTRYAKNNCRHISHSKSRTNYGLQNQFADFPYNDGTLLIIEEEGAFDRSRDH